MSKQHSIVGGGALFRFARWLHGHGQVVVAYPMFTIFARIFGATQAVFSQLLILEQRGEFQKALRVAEYWCKKTQHPEFRFQVADFLNLSGAVDEAINQYQQLYAEQSIRGESPDLAVLNNLVLLLTKNERYDDAAAIVRTEYRFLLAARFDYEVDPINKVANAFLNVGNAMYEAGHFSEGEALFRRGAEVVGRDEVRFVYSIGNCLLKQERYEAALEYYDRALVVAETDEERGRIEHAKSEAYRELGETSKAEEARTRSKGYGYSPPPVQ